MKYEVWSSLILVIIGGYKSSETIVLLFILILSAHINMYNGIDFLSNILNRYLKETFVVFTLIKSDVKY